MAAARYLKAMARLTSWLWTSCWQPHLVHLGPEESKMNALKTILIGLAVFTAPTTAFACSFNTDCQPGSHTNLH
jgi:hypothetical protein